MNKNNNFHVNDAILATKGQRFINNIIDTFFIYLLIAVVLGVFGIIMELTGILNFDEWIEEENVLVEYLIYYFFMILYYIFFKGYFSRSIAKYITNTVVVMKDGSKPDFETIGKRSLCRLIPFNALSFLGSKSTGWHDTMSKTFVVDKKLFENYKNKIKEMDEINEIGKSEE